MMELQLRRTTWGRLRSQLLRILDQHDGNLRTQDHAVATDQRGGRAEDVVGFCSVADGSIRSTPPFS